MSDTLPNLAGGCLCGQVRYTLNAKPKALNACHCTDCQTLTGSPFRVTVSTAESDTAYARKSAASPCANFARARSPATRE